MSERLNDYFTKMDSLLALDNKYKRPGYTMDMNDCIYLYILAVYSLLMLKKLGVKVDAHLHLPHLMSEKASPRYVYGLAYYDDEEEEEDYNTYNYYANQWAEMYESYTGNLSRKNAFYELSDFMYRYFEDIRKKNHLGLWTLFSEADCMEFYSSESCSTELLSDTGIPKDNTLSRAVAYFMHSRGSIEMLSTMCVDISKETEHEMDYALNNTLFIYGIFALTSAKTEKIVRALDKGNIHDMHIKNFIEKCGGLYRFMWRPGATILADYTNDYEAVTRTQIIGVDNDFEVSFDYADISPLLPVYLYYLEKAAEEVDNIYFNGQILREDTDGKQKRKNQQNISKNNKFG